MEYNLVTGVWEITMNCNMNCEHCGSSCKGPLPDELTTEEALSLCDDLGQLDVEWITISGGEPLLRKDWHIIAQGLRKNDIIPNMITSGWSLSEEEIGKAVDAGINTLAISLDGLEKTHDMIRKEGSYKRIIRSLDLLKDSEIHPGIITTISKWNIDQLQDIKEILVEKEVNTWQLQFALPMGNFSEKREWLIEPGALKSIVDFAYDVYENTDIKVVLSDCFGYCHEKTKEMKSFEWQGCFAGKQNIGILQNGDIVPCTSIRDKSFIEGNIRERSIIEIWEDPESFAWNRDLEKYELNGLCSKCYYGNQCLGGCSNTRLTIENDVYGENKYCLYNYSMKCAEEKINRVTNVSELKKKGRILAEVDDFQLAELVIKRALEFEPEDIELLNLYGYINYELGNYYQAEEINKKVLEKEPDNIYALSGLGVTLYALDEKEKGLNKLSKAVELTDESFLKPYYDLAIILIREEDFGRAEEVIKEGIDLKEDFQNKFHDLPEEIKDEINLSCF